MTLKLLMFFLIGLGIVGLYGGVARAAEEVTITLLYDNYQHDENLSSDWGFSCLIRGLEKTILFDTGAQGKLLLQNMHRLNINPAEIDVVILSHWHSDHVGGIDELVELNQDLEVYLIGSLFGQVQRNLKSKDIPYTKVEQAGKIQICEHVYSTGLINGSPDEQSLVIETAGGNILITGCSHHGIVRMIGEVQQEFGNELLLVMGGMHLHNKKQAEIEEIINQVQQTGVKYVAPSHCTGETAQQLFAKRYQDKYITLGVGKVISLEALLQEQ